MTPDASVVRKMRTSPTAFVAVLALFLVAGLIVYSPVLGAFFHSDDFVLLHRVQQGGPFALWSGRPDGFLRPIVALSLFCDYRVWGLNATGFHATNVLIHGANAWLVYCVTGKLLNASNEQAGRNKLLAFVAGVLFLVHPSHPEAVAWISGRTDVIATFFALGSFFAYLTYRRDGRRWALWLSLLLFAGGLASKESVVGYPLVLFAYEGYRVIGQRQSRRVSPAPFLFLLMLPVYLAARWVLLGGIVAGYGAATHLHVTWLGLVDSVAFFFASGFLPRMPRLLFCVAAFGLILLAVAAQVRAKRPLPPALGFLMTAFVLAFLPVLSLGGGGAPTGAEGRLVYLPAAFACAALALLLGFLFGSNRRLFGAAACVVLVFGYQLNQSNQTWRAAGELTRGVVQSLKPLASARTIIVLVVPDRLYPAYVFRNGLEVAAALFYPGKRGRVLVVSTADLYSKDDAVVVERNGDRYWLRVSSAVRPPHARVVTLASPRSAQHTAELLAPDTVRVDLRNLGENDRVVCYVQGELVALTK